MAVTLRSHARGVQRLNDSGAVLCAGLLLTTLVFLGGCGGDGGNAPTGESAGDAAPISQASVVPQTPPTPLNQSPVISGVPPSVVFEGEVYEFEKRVVTVSFAAPVARVDQSYLDGVDHYTAYVAPDSPTSEPGAREFTSDFPAIDLELETGRRYLVAITASDLAGITSPMSEPVYIDLRAASIDKE